jgi:flagellar basal-body rod modification protein FlgD
MTSPISSIGATPGTVPTAEAVAQGATTQSGSSSSTAGALDPQAFLQLLVAQLKYQDPSSPMDTSTFMTQTATLSQVQSMTSMQTTLTSLASAQQSQAATDLIGKTVTFVDASGNRGSGVVDSASLASSGATVSVGNVSVPLSSVVQVTSTK